MQKPSLARPWDRTTLADSLHAANQLVVYLANWPPVLQPVYVFTANLLVVLHAAVKIVDGTAKACWSAPADRRPIRMAPQHAVLIAPAIT